MSSTKRNSNLGSSLLVIKKKSENLFCKSLNLGNWKYNLKEETKESEHATFTKRYYTRGNSRKDSLNLELHEDSKIADQEYTLSLKKYLQEAINENDKLREKIKLLKDDNDGLRNEINNKNDVILELHELYQQCQKHHMSEVNNKLLGNKVKKGKSFSPI